MGLHDAEQRSSGHRSLFVILTGTAVLETDDEGELH